MSAKAHGIRPELLAAALYTESNFDPNAKSPAGAIGIGQFMPQTAASLGIDPHDPDQSIDGMAKLLSQYEQQFGSESLALAAYNAGPGAVQDAGNSIPNISETQSYVSKILALANGEQPLSVTAGSGTGDSGSHPGGLSAIIHVFDSIGSAAFWRRIGIGVVGAVVILVALDQLTRGKVSKAAEHVGESVAQKAGTAASAAALV
jgi:hypothetical protein